MQNLKLHLSTFKFKSKKFMRFYCRKVVMFYKRVTRKLGESTIREKFIGFSVMILFVWSVYFVEFYKESSSSTKSTIITELYSSPKPSNITVKFMNGKCPNLWHPPKENANESTDRFLLQREWMKYLSEVPDNALEAKTILVYSKAYHGVKHEDHPVAENMHCPADHNLKYKCRFEEAECSTTRNIENYDAIVSKEHCIEDLEQSMWQNIKVAKVIPHIYVTIESPWSSYYPNVDLSVNNKIFVNYKTNSDIPIPYGKWIPFPGNVSEKKPYRNYAKGRKTKAAIVLWGCNWNWKNNNSLRYVRELKKHITVDIYGDCGKPGCSKDEPQKCLEMLQKKYKFYLAFENANCREYITDNFFRTALNNDIVPVVLGAHPEDYQKIAPKHSYIHVEQFNSPKELAKYLRILGKNDNLYNDYFMWKGTGEFVDTKSDLFCRLCAMLIYNDYVPQHKYPPRSYTKRPTACLPAHKWYWTRANDGHRVSEN